MYKFNLIVICPRKVSLHDNLEEIKSQLKNILANGLRNPVFANSVECKHISGNELNIPTHAKR